MENWIKYVGAFIALASLAARVIQEDLKRTRLRYYLRPMKAPEGHRASILTVVNTGRSTARNVLVYISPRHPETDEPPMVSPRPMVATDERWHTAQSPNRNDLIVRFPELHPSDRFNVSFAWKGGAEVFTRKQKDCFRISYEYGTSNKLLRLFGRVHSFWWWKRVKENNTDELVLPTLPIHMIAQEVILNSDQQMLERLVNPNRTILKVGREMASIVLELQRDALDESIKSASILRKALFVAKKLDIESSIAWIESELEGYRGEVEIPDYRHVVGRTTARTATQVLPVIFEDPELSRLTSTFNLPISITEIESLLEGRSPGMLLAIPLPPSLQTTFSSFTPFSAIFMFEMDYSQIEHIQQSVRTNILNWALKLEEEGVLGEGYSFSEEELERGNGIVINIYGDASNVQIQQAGDFANQHQTIAAPLNEELIRYMDKVTEQLETLELDENGRNEIVAELRTISVQLESPSPKKSIIAQALGGLLRILSSVAAHELVQEGIALISSLV